MDKEKTAQTIKEVSAKYKRIYTSIFKYGIFIILIIIAIAKTRGISNQEYTASAIIDQDLEIKKTKLIGSFSSRLAQGKGNPDIKTYITLGEFKKDNEIFQSYNNLLTYKWYVVPRLFWISNNMPLQPISYYEKDNYSINEMDTFFKNMIIASNKGLNLNNKQPQLLINKDIVTDFNLQCLFQKKIYNGICDIYITNFIKSFFIYTIQTDINWFKNVFNSLVWDTTYKQNLCTQLTNYVLYSNNTSDEIAKLFGSCPESNFDIFNKFVYFSEVQKELENKFISKKVYNDDMINTYKIISFQQIMYDDINKKRINTDRINGYIDFIQEILKKNMISKFYKEVIYYFNNYYLIKSLEDPEIINKVGDKSEIDKITKRLETINNGNQLIGFEGLVNNINSKIIIQGKSYIPENTGNNDITSTLETLLGQIDNLTIREKIFSGNNILLKAIWQVQNSNNTSDWANNLKLGTKLRLQEKDKVLYVKQIDIEWYPDFTQTINQLIQKQTWGFADLQRYINQNQAILNQKESQSVANTTEKNCQKIIQELSGQDVQKCDQNKIVIDILRKNKVISLNVSHDSFVPNKIDISDTEAKTILTNYINQPEITAQLQGRSINDNTITDFIKDIIKAIIDNKPLTNTGNFEWSSNTIIIMEKVKNYLGVVLTDIVEKNWKILIQFSINGVNFIGNYNFEEQKIQTLYFKDAAENNNPLLIKNLTLTLDNDHKADLENFVTNPLNYIKENSPESYLMYQKFTSSKLQ